MIQRTVVGGLWCPRNVISMTCETGIVGRRVALFERPFEHREVMVGALVSVNEDRGQGRRRAWLRGAIRQRPLRYGSMQDRGKHVFGRRVWMEEDRGQRTSWGVTKGGVRAGR